MAKLVSAPITISVTNIPSWAPDPGQYATISLGTPINQPSGSVDPCPSQRCVYSGTHGFTGKWQAWNGGAYAPTLGAMGSLLIFGGGHNAYMGNEVIAYNIAKREFERLSEPALYNESNVAADGSYPNGTPYPNHTNMGCEFLPEEAGGGPLGSFVFVSHWQTGVRITNPTLWKFNLSTRTWSKGPQGLPLGDSLMGLVYDSKRRGLWGLDSGGSKPLVWIDTIRNSFQQVHAGGIIAYWYSSMAYLPSIDSLIIWQQNNRCTVVSLSNFVDSIPPASLSPRYTPNMSGTRMPSLGTQNGRNYQHDRMEFVPIDGALWGIQHNGRPSTGEVRMYRCSVPTSSPQIEMWQWTNEVLAPKPGDPRGTPAIGNRGSGEGDVTFYGRARFVPLLKAFVFHDYSNGVGHLPAQAARPSTFK